ATAAAVPYRGPSKESQVANRDSSAAPGEEAGSRREARISGCGTHADPGTGGAAARTDGALDRSRSGFTTDRSGCHHARRDQSVDSRSTENLRRHGGSALGSASAHRSRSEGIAMINQLPA